MTKTKALAAWAAKHDSLKRDMDLIGARIAALKAATR